MPSAANFDRPARAVPTGTVAWGGSFTANSGTNRVVSGNVVELARIPAGAQIQDVIYTNTQLGAGVSLSIGFAGVTTAIANAVDANSARAGTIVGYVSTVAADTTLLAQITGGVTVTSGTFGAVVRYSMDPANSV